MVVSAISNDTEHSGVTVHCHSSIDWSFGIWKISVRIDILLLCCSRFCSAEYIADVALSIHLLCGLRKLSTASYGEASLVKNENNDWIPIELVRDLK